MSRQEGEPGSGQTPEYRVKAPAESHQFGNLAELARHYRMPVI
jgi:hypothetical protein